MSVWKIAAMAFVFMTLGSVLLLSYSMYEYFGVYYARHMFNVRVERFDVSVFDGSHASAETLLAIQNPSTYTFEVRFVLQKLYINEDLFGMKAYDMETNPVLMGPQSNTTIAIRIDAGFQGVSKITESGEKNWSTLIHVGVIVPLVGRSTIRFWETLVPTLQP